MRKEITLLALFIFLSTTFLEARIWKRVGPNAGYVSMLIPDRSNPDVWYCIADNNLYRSTDAAKSWQRLPFEYVWYVTLFPPSGEVFVLGARSIDGQAALYYSADQGSHFQLRSLSGNSIGSLFIHPRDPRILYAFGFSDWDLAISTDGGSHWSVVNKLPFVIGKKLPKDLAGGAGYVISNYAFGDLLVSPADDKTVYLTGTVIAYAGYDEEQDISVLLVSHDKGYTWQTISAQNAAFGWYTGFHSDPAFPDRAFLLGTAGIKAFNGNTWQKWSNVALNRIVSIPNTPGSLLGLRTDPTSNLRYKVMISADLGKTWREFNVGFERVSLLQTMQDGLLAALGPAGLYRRATGDHWREANQGFALAPLGQISTDAAEGTTLYGSLNSEFLYRSRDAGRTWENLTFNLPGDIARLGLGSITVNPSNPSRVILSNRRTLLTADGGASWSFIGKRYNCPAFDSIHSNIVYFSRGKEVFRSIEGGLHPQLLPLKFRNSYIRAVVDPFDDRTVFFLAGNEGVYKSTNAGRSMKRIENLGSALTLAPLPQPNSYLLSIYDKGIYRTTDGGESWHLVSTKLREAFKLGAATSQHLFALDSQRGFRFYETTDAGKTWVKINSEFPGRPGVTNFSDPRAPFFYVTTDRGLFVANQ